ncbi:MAG: hypothetical protein JXA10_10295 [Anaerolineae bacterium]|nr:hypothetical protein [Anaerolineae bacterium]
MGSGPNLVFNLVTIVFLVLTVITGVIVLGVVMDSMDPPVFAPATDVPPPTQFVPATLTPSPGPTEQMMMTQEAAFTPTPEN